MLKLTDFTYTAPLPFMGQFLAAIVILLYTPMGCQDAITPDDAWEGSYAMVQTCDGSTNPGYTMEVQPAAEEPPSIYLTNLGGYGKKVEATVAGDSLTIIPTDANVGLMGKVQLSGTGKRQNQELFIDLIVEVPGPQGTTTTSTCQLRGTPIEE